MDKQETLRREVGVVGAVMLGLGSILGAGAFVTLGVAAGPADSMLLLAVLLAAGVAICNGLSSAQLAAAHPVSGGTYEYARRWISPRAGFVAGWMFLLAKSASAATAALGFAGYLTRAAGWNLPAPLLATAATLVLTAIVYCGLRRTTVINTLIVSMTIGSLLGLIALVAPQVDRNANLANWYPQSGMQFRDLLQATALVFVAYTGYGRVATLGEEIENPRRNIPRAVIVTLIVSMLLYLGIAYVGVGVLSAKTFADAAAQSAAPLETLASKHSTGLVLVVVVGAVTAMLGVLLNLILGLSRVLFAMGRRGDMPPAVGVLSEQREPTRAILAIGMFIAALTWLGDVRLTWSFSAFSVLIYYSLTNLSAIRMRPEERLYPIWPAYLGFVACATLAFWVSWPIWVTGGGILIGGILLREILHRWYRTNN